MANPARPGRVGRTVKRGAGKRIVEGTGFRLADEVRSIQRRAANHDGRIITIGQLVLFSTDTGNAWLLDRSDQLAARLARNGELDTVHIEETDTAFSIGWKGSYRLDTGVRLFGSGNRSGRHHPWVSDRQNRCYCLVLESPGFAQNFGSCGEVEGLHLVGVL